MQLASFDRAVDCAPENNGLERAGASSRGEFRRPIAACARIYSQHQNQDHFHDANGGVWREEMLC
jgi:hypothetical protein